MSELTVFSISGRALCLGLKSQSFISLSPPFRIHHVF